MNTKFSSKQLVSRKYAYTRTYFGLWFTIQSQTWNSLEYNERISNSVFVVEILLGKSRDLFFSFGSLFFVFFWGGVRFTSPPVTPVNSSRINQTHRPAFFASACHMFFFTLRPGA